AYERAVALDDSYRTRYRNAGLAYFKEKRYAEAEAEHRRALEIAPDDPVAHFGLGRLAVRRQHWVEAERWLRRAIELDPSLVEAYRALGDVLARLGRDREAIDVYERSLFQAVRGTRGLNSAIVTVRNAERSADDPHHGIVYARVAQAYGRLGNSD